MKVFFLLSRDTGTWTNSCNNHIAATQVLCLVYLFLDRFMAIFSDLSFVIVFLMPEDFCKVLDVCGELVLDVTDTVILGTIEPLPFLRFQHFFM